MRDMGMFVRSVRPARLLPVAALAALVALVVVPEAVHACAVCFDARAENRIAFLATTAFLSLLPLGMVAGAGVWLRRRMVEIDETVASDGTGADALTDAATDRDG